MKSIYEALYCSNKKFILVVIKYLILNRVNTYFLLAKIDGFHKEPRSRLQEFGKVLLEMLMNMILSSYCSLCNSIPKSI